MTTEPAEDSQKKFPMSVVILTKNVEDLLPDCLQSCQWADDILVVDSGSRDGTVDIAKANGAFVVHQGWMGFGLQRQFAVSQAIYDWVVCIDADERLTPELSEAIRRAVTESQAAGEKGHHVFSFPRKTWFLGRFLKHGGAYPDLQTRLFHRKYARWNSAPVEEKLECSETPVTLKAPMLHYPSKNLSEYLNKQIQFAYIQAAYLQKQKKGHSSARMFLSPFLRFLKCYVLKAGFLDGMQGFIHISCGCIYSFVKYAHVSEAQQNAAAAAARQEKAQPRASSQTQTQS